MSEHDELMRELSGVAPDVAEVLAPDLFEMPTFTFEVESKSKIHGAEKMNGKVVMKFPNMGDDLDIERRLRALGGGSMANMYATLHTCIIKAPATWYELKAGSKTPTLNLSRLPDDAVLADLYLAFTDWQRSFR